MRRFPISIPAVLLSALSAAPAAAQIETLQDFTIVVEEMGSDPCEGTPALMDECGDGSFYVGQVSGAPLFLLKTGNTRQFATSDSYNLPGVTTSTGDNPTGEGNMTVMRQYDASLTKFPAALECSELGAGWFLPSVNELMTVWSNLAESGKQYFFVDKVNMMTSNSMASASPLIPNDNAVHLYADVGGRTGGYAARNPSSNVTAKTSSAEVMCARR